MAKNKIFRSPNPGLGQGKMQAVSEKTGWRYEHDETDAQIDAIETLIESVRNDSGAATDNDGREDDTGLPLRGATFTWNTDEEGNVVISTIYAEDGPADSVVSPGGGFEPVSGKQWTNEVWKIAPDGTVSEG
jgi:hypothetical protein